MANDASIRLGVNGEKEFRNAISGINAQMKNLSSEMKAAVTSLTGLDNAEELAAKKTDILGRSMTKNKERLAVLSEEYDRQQKKLAELSAALDAAKTAEYANAKDRVSAITKATNAYNLQAKKVSDLGTKINNATVDMNKMAAELNKIAAESNQSETALEALTRTISDQETRLAELKKRYGNAVLEFGETSKEAKRLKSEIGGLSAELNENKSRLQKVEAAAEKAGKSLKDMGDDAEVSGGKLSNFKSFLGAGLVVQGISSLVSGLMGAVDSANEMQRSMSRLEINAQTAGQSMTAVNENFRQFTALTQQADSSAEAMSNLLQTGFDENGLTQAVDALSGAVVQFPDTLNIESLADGLQETLATGTATGQFGELLDRVGVGAENFSTALAQCTTDAEKQNLVLETLAEAGLNDVWAQYEQANGGVLSFQDSMTLLQQSLSTLVQSILPLVAPAFATIADAVSSLVTAFSEGGFTGLLEQVGNMVQNMADQAISQGPVLATAGQEMLSNIIDGFVSALPNVITTVGDFISRFFDTLKTYGPQMIQRGFEILTNLLTGIINAIPTLVAQLPKIITSITGFLSSNLPKIIEGGVKLLLSLAKGIITSIPKLVAQLPQLIVAIAQGIDSLLQSIIEAGVNIVKGLWEGIKKAKDWLIGKVKDWCGSLLDAVKRFFGINSPSRVMRDEVGLMLARGMAEGITDGERDVLNAAEQLNEKLLAKEEELTKKLEDTGLDEATKTALQNQLSLVQEFRTEYEQALQNIQKSQEDMASKLQDYGDLFTTVKDETGEFLELGDLQADIDAINQYGLALEQLKGRGISESLLDEITSMNVDDALAYTDKLLGMTDEKYDAYMALWDEKQAAAQKVAREFYQQEFDMLSQEYVDKLPVELDGIKTEMYQLGIYSAQGLADGFVSQYQCVKNQFIGMLQEAYAAAKESMEVNSPSKLYAELGKYMAQGVGVGFAGAMPKVSNGIISAMMAPIDRASNGGIYNATAAAVNGMAAVGSVSSTQTIIIPVHLNGKQIAEVVFDPLKKVAKQRGVALV